MHSKFRTTFATAAAAALVLGSAGMAVASSVDVSVVDITAPVSAVSIEQGQSAPIVITASVTGAQAGTATFEVYRDWTLSGGVFTGSNPQEFTVQPRSGGQSADVFSTTGEITVDAAQAAGGPFTLSVGAFDITNSNTTGAKLEAGSSNSYEVTVLEAPSAGDTTPPVIDYVLTPSSPDGVNGWYKSDVTLEWTVTEEESPSSLEKTGCVDQSITEDQFETSYSCSATSDGGSAGPVEVKIKRDATAPTITWGAGSPADGASYYFGDAIPTADCTADDATSGVNADGCEVTGGGTAVGSHTLTAKATDHAGNETIETRTYTVLAWTLDGFYRPVDMGKVNTVKAGSTVPLKFNVFKGDERLTSGIGASFSAKKMNCESGAVEDMIEEIATTGKTELRYDADGQQWVQNWATPKSGGGSCYLVKMTTADGTSITADFKLK
jgi:hypothetical protein